MLGIIYYVNEREDYYDYIDICIQGSGCGRMRYLDGDEKKRGSRILYITIMECKLKKGGQTID